MFTIGVDQESGEVTGELTEIRVDGLQGEVTHGEWLPDSRTVVAVAKEGPGRHALLTVPAGGGTARVFHRFESDHDLPGVAVRRDGGRVAFIAPAGDTSRDNGHTAGYPVTRRNPSRSTGPIAYGT